MRNRFAPSSQSTFTRSTPTFLPPRVVLFAQVNGGDPNAGAGLELEVIAAVVIGGASLSGGVGTVMGALLGVLILGVLENGVNACGVPVEVKFILIGAIVIVNTALSVWQRRRMV